MSEAKNENVKTEIIEKMKLSFDPPYRVRTFSDSQAKAFFADYYEILGKFDKEILKSAFDIVRRSIRKNSFWPDSVEFEKAANEIRHASMPPSSKVGAHEDVKRSMAQHDRANQEFSRLFAIHYMDVWRCNIRREFPEYVHAQVFAQFDQGRVENEISVPMSEVIIESIAHSHGIKIKQNASGAPDYDGRGKNSLAAASSAVVTKLTHETAK